MNIYLCDCHCCMHNVQGTLDLCLCLSLQCRVKLNFCQLVGIVIEYMTVLNQFETVFIIEFTQLEVTGLYF